MILTATPLCFVACGAGCAYKYLHRHPDDEMLVLAGDNDELLPLAEGFEKLLNESEHSETAQPERFCGEAANEIVVQDPQQAALGLDAEQLGVSEEVQKAMVGKDEESVQWLLNAMEKEVAALSGIRAMAEEECDEEKSVSEEEECMRYCLYEAAGSSDKRFPNSPHPRDCDANGVRRDRRNTSGEGMRLEDFAKCTEAAEAKLTRAEVLVLRMYTTALYKHINGPLRARQSPHPLPVTTWVLSAAISKLRAVRKRQASNPQAIMVPEGFTSWMQPSISSEPLDDRLAMEMPAGAQRSDMNGAPLPFASRWRQVSKGAISKLVGKPPDTETMLEAPPPSKTRKFGRAFSPLFRRKPRQREAPAASKRKSNAPRRKLSVLGVELEELPSRRDAAKSVSPTKARSQSLQYTSRLDLWRGMRDALPGRDFIKDGGAELAPTSTSVDPLVALEYALRDNTSGRATIFKLDTDFFMNRGVDLRFCSAYPEEREFLYPPCTCAMPSPS